MNEVRRRSAVHVPQGFGAPHRPGQSGPTFLDSRQYHALATRRQRLMVLGGLFGLAWLVLVFQLFNLAVFNGDRASGASTRIVSVDKTLRRDIVDRNAQLLATSLKTVTLYADARDIADADEAARGLMSVFPEFDYADLKKKLESERAWVVLRHDLTPRQHASVHALGFPGFRFEERPRRIYPKGSLASHVVGFVGSENKGLIGLERTLNDALASDAADGPVELSLDLRVQYIMRDELIRSMLEFKAKAATGLVLDVTTGEILALVSLPDFDPNDIGAASNNQLFNRATMGVYEMGSTFKAFNTAMALDGGKIDIDDQFDASAPYKVANRTIHDFHPENRWLSVAEVFMVSSNIGSARIAHQVGAEKQSEFLERLGLFDRAEVEIPEIGRPLLPVKWGPTETATVSYGHGISVSPLSIAVAMASLVNGGYKVEPTILRQRDYDPGTRTRVVREETSRQMRRLMRQVVTQGTASQADVPGYSVGGKTGTADKPSAGGYDRRALITSFAGIFPSDKPRYLVLALLDEPKGTPKTHNYRTAGWNAAPTVGAVVRRVAPALGVRPTAEVSPFAETAQLASTQR